MGNSPLHGRVLVLGIDDAGKTTFLNKYEHPAQEIPTEPTEAYVVRKLKAKGVELNVWDVAGKESTRSFWKHYYAEKGTDAILWVIDGSASEEKLEESRSCLNGAMMDPALQGVLLFVLVNKKDQSDCKSTEEMTKFLSLSNQDGKRTWKIFDMSAKDGSGIKEAMDALAKEIKTIAKSGSK